MDVICAYLSTYNSPDQWTSGKDGLGVLRVFPAKKEIFINEMKYDFNLPIIKN